MSIRLETLGGLQVYQDGIEVEPLRSWKLRLGLLIHLAYQGEATRDQLTSLFWPEKPERRSRSSLSTAVSDLRKACGRDCILTKGEIYRAGRGIELDAREFQEAAGKGDHQKAIDLYRGPFLSGISLVGTSSFEHWVGGVHSRLTGIHRRVCSRTIEKLTEEGKLLEALVHARNWVEMEPEDDGPVQTVMRLLAMDGRRAEAMRHFDNFRSSLALLDEEPLEETSQLAEQIRSGAVVGPARVPEFGNRAVSEIIDSGDEAPPAAADPGRLFTGENDRRTKRNQRPWIVELAETMKDWWVFRGVLAFFTVTVVAIGVADGLGVPPVTVRQLLALAVGILILLAPSLWAMEPWLRGQLGFDPPRTWRGRPKDPTRGLWHRRGLLISGAAAVGVVMALALWPRSPTLVVAAPEPASRLRLAFLPLLPADTTDEELSYLAEDISRQVVAHFREFDALRVPNWRSVSGYRDPTLSQDSIISGLGVDYFLAGEISLDRDSIRIRWDLEDGQSVGEQIQVSVAGSTATNRMSVLSDIVGQITDRLRAKLGEVIVRRELRLGTNNTEAWVAFEEGRRLSNGVIRMIPSSPAQAAWMAHQADSLLALASSLDPTWPEPLLLRADIAPRLVFISRISGDRDVPFVPGVEGFSALGHEALARIEEALARDPENKKALHRRATLLLDWEAHFGSLDPREREDNIRRAGEDLQRASVGLTPDPESMGLLAVLLARDRGDYVQARRYGREALQQDPWLETRADVTYWLAMSHFELGEDREALALCSDALERGTSEGGTAWMLAECQLTVMALGDLPNPSPDSAWVLLERTVLQADADPGMGGPQDTGRFAPRGLLLYAGVLGAAGLPDSAQIVLDGLEGIRSTADGTGIVFPLAAGVFARLGRHTEGFEILSGLLQGPGFDDPRIILNSRELASLRGFPPFDSLRSAVNGNR